MTRSARFEQLGEKSVCLNRALSMTLCLPDMDYDWLHLDGAWGARSDYRLSIKVVSLFTVSKELVVRSTIPSWL